MKLAEGNPSEVQARLGFVREMEHFLSMRIKANEQVFCMIEKEAFVRLGDCEDFVGDYKVRHRG